MLERLRRRGWASVLGIAVAAIAVVALVVVGATLLAADDVADACRAPTAAPPAETALMPAGLSFEQIGTVTSVEQDDGHVTVEAVTDKPLDEVTVLIQDAVVAAGYRPAGMDNEGDEAEVFFTTGSLAAGQARLEESDCEGQWDIDLVLVDLEAEPSP